MHSKRPLAVKTKAGVYIILEVTVEGVQVLFQIHIEKGQSPLLVVQCHSYPHWVHCDSQVWTPAVVEELVFMPEEWNGQRKPHNTALIRQIWQFHCLRQVAMVISSSNCFFYESGCTFYLAKEI